MRRITTLAALVTGVILTTSGAASAVTVTIGSATATTVGAWVKPTACSQFPIEYAGIPADATTSINVLDADTRTDLGSELILPSHPTSGRVNIEVCNHQVKDTLRILLSLDVRGIGVADSAPFAWSPRPSTVRCVNKRTYTIREYPGRTCPSGWVKR